ncbi:hypothetical protein U9M48_037531 [Paspalum notatum var. saurae]|uniref:DUF4283 domain-containing protein n=1 Tax=Paspalum notatum var. saurae TaxID=547442 RepID=A0AAQ3UH91_PASNO
MAVSGLSADDGEPRCDGGAEAGEGRSRRRRRRRRRSSGPSGPPPPPLCSSKGGSSSKELFDDGEVQVPSRVLARTARLLNVEDDLRRALIITCIGNCGDVPVEDVSGQLARRFDLVAEDLVFKRISSSELLLLLPDEATAVRVYDSGRPVVAPAFRLHLARWTRFYHSSGTALSQVVDVELRGIPAHAWGVDTAALLLDEVCLISEVYQDAEDSRDVFRLRA